MNLGLLMTLTQPEARSEEEFNAWYDDEHMAERLSISGFVSARRWISRAVPGPYLATHETEGLGVFSIAVCRAHCGDNRSPWPKRNPRRLKVIKRWVAQRNTPESAFTREGPRPA